AIDRPRGERCWDSLDRHFRLGARDVLDLATEALEPLVLGSRFPEIGLDPGDLGAYAIDPLAPRRMLGGEPLALVEGGLDRVVDTVDRRMDAVETFALTTGRVAQPLDIGGRRRERRVGLRKL